MVGVILYSKARVFSAARTLSISAIRMSAAREKLHVEAGVEHVRRCHALMHEARLGADDFCQMGEEGDHVVLGLTLDCVDARDIEGHALGLGPDGFRRFLGMTPSSACASAACASISNQIWKRVCGSHIAVISGRE